MKVKVSFVLRNITKFQQLTDISDHAFGKNAMNNPKFLKDARKAQYMTFRTAHKCGAYMVGVLQDSNSQESKNFRQALETWIKDNPLSSDTVSNEVFTALPVIKSKGPLVFLDQALDIKKSSKTLAKKSCGQTIERSHRSSPRLQIIKASYAEPVKTAAHNIVIASPAAQIQQHALSNDVRDAVNVLKRKWPSLWMRICEKARSQNERPIPFMVSLLEAQIGKVNK